MWSPRVRLRWAERVLFGCLAIGLLANGVLTSDAWSIGLGALALATIAVFGFGRPLLRLLFSVGVMVLAASGMAFVAADRAAKHDWVGAAEAAIGFVLAASVLAAGTRKRWHGTGPHRAS